MSGLRCLIGAVGVVFGLLILQPCSAQEDGSVSSGYADESGYGDASGSRVTGYDVDRDPEGLSHRPTEQEKLRVEMLALLQHRVHS